MERDRNMATRKPRAAHIVACGGGGDFVLRPTPMPMLMPIHAHAPCPTHTLVKSRLERGGKGEGHYLENRRVVQLNRGPQYLISPLFFGSEP